MQNSQDINWYEIGKIVIPSLVALIFPFITYWWLSRKMANYQKDLSKEIESYKIELNKELENYKFQLQSEFQMSFYEFQTRFSQFHQQKSLALSELYSILIELGTAVDHTFYWTTEEDRKCKFKKAMNGYNKYIDYYLKNQIFFDDELCISIEDIRDLISKMMDCYVSSDFYLQAENSSDLLPHIAQTRKEELEIHNIFKEKFPELRQKLRNEFRQILSVENPKNQLVKIND